MDYVDLAQKKSLKKTLQINFVMMNVLLVFLLLILYFQEFIDKIFYFLI